MKQNATYNRKRGIGNKWYSYCISKSNLKSGFSEDKNLYSLIRTAGLLSLKQNFLARVDQSMKMNCL